MVTLLRRLFIRNYRNVRDEKVRIAHGVLAAWFGLISNFLLVAMKLTAAFLLAAKSNWQVFSIALLADAMNNVSDMASCLVTLFSFRLSSKRPDQEHPFGHQRIEYIAALIVSILVLFVGVEFLRESITKIVEGTLVDYDVLTLTFLGISILIKILQGYVYLALAKCIQSLALKAQGVDALMDVLTTALVLVSAIFAISPLHWNFLDAWIGLAVSLFIIYEGIAMIKEASDPLIGEPNNEALSQEIQKKVLSHQQVLGVHDFIIHSYGASNQFVTFDVEVNQSLSLVAAHELIDSIEREIRHDFRVQVSIHVDPVEVGNPIYDTYKARALAIVQSIDDKASIHDFQIQKGPDFSTISFDVLLPYMDENKREEIADAVIKEFQKIDSKYHFSIQFDHPY